MEINFRNSNIGCYQIVEIDGHSQKYIMDTSTLKPKRYCWGLFQSMYFIIINNLFSTELRN